MEKLAVLGLGLIGGSLGLALQQAGVAKHISGYDSNQSSTYQAWKIGAITEICDKAENAVEGADMVILATPILAMRELLERYCTQTQTWSSCNRHSKHQSPNTQMGNNIVTSSCNVCRRSSNGR